VYSEFGVAEFATTMAAAAHWICGGTTARRGRWMGILCATTTAPHAPANFGLGVSPFGLLPILLADELQVRHDPGGAKRLLN